MKLAREQKLKHPMIGFRRNFAKTKATFLNKVQNLQHCWCERLIQKSTYNKYAYLLTGMRSQAHNSGI